MLYGEQVAQEIEDAVQREVSETRNNSSVRTRRTERLEQIERANAMTDVLVADMLPGVQKVFVDVGKHRQHTHRKKCSWHA